MRIYNTKNNEIINSIINTPELLELTDQKEGGATIDPSYDYLVAVEANSIIGMFHIRKVTNLVTEGHIRILPQYWKTDLPERALQYALEYVKETGARKVLTEVPGNCFHVLGFLKKHGFIQCGCLHEGIIYHNQLTSLVFYEKAL